MRRILSIAVGGAVVVFIAALVAIQFSAVDVWLFRRAVHATASRPSPVVARDGELAALLVGTGTPLADAGRAGPSTLIAAGSHLYLVDAGIDSARNLQLWRVPLEKIDAVLITHLHSDHIGGLGEIRLQSWVAGRTTPLRVYGPPGIERVVAGFNEAYAIDDGFRVAHHGAAMLPPGVAPLVAVPITISDGTTTAGVVEALGLRVTAIRVRHDPATPAYGYRFDFEGRSITISGDTAYDENLGRAARGSDLLVHEALSPELVGILHDELAAAGRPRGARIMHDIPSYHTAPVDAARIANMAGARLLVFTHMLPILPNDIAVRGFLRGVSDVRRQGVRVGHDGMVVRLPGHSGDINVGKIN